jgi:tripartite-type tricarboxylate transporter receptor subunit TctC
MKGNESGERGRALRVQRARIRRSRLIGAVATCCTVASLPALAGEAPEAYPSKPVRLVVAQGIGSSVDTLGRIIGAQLGEMWGKQVIVDNRGGAGGTIGAEIAARAAPDGYTLLISSTAMQVISPQLYKKLPYHPIKDFTPIAMLAITHNVLVANQGVPFKTVKELIAYAKANPGKLNMANAGSGFQSHLAAVLFTHMAGIDVHHIPYKGGTSVMNIIAGESHITIVPAPSVMTQVRAGKVRVIGTGGDKRSPLIPDVPTIAESGVPGFVSTGWAGLMAPKGLPKPIFDKVYASLEKMMKDPVTREHFTRQGADPIFTTPAEMVTMIEAEYGRFGQAVKLAGLTIQ